VWTKDISDPAQRLICGQIYAYVSPNQYGGNPYLWALETTVAPNTGTTWGMHDAMNGKLVLKVVNGPPGQGSSSSGAFYSSVVLVQGEDGSLLGYYINSTSMTLNKWNSSRAIIQHGLVTRQNPNVWAWRPPYQGLVNWSLGIEWSVPLVTTMTASNGTVVNINQVYAESAGVNSPLAIGSIIDDVVIVDNTPGDVIAFHQPGYIIQMAFSAGNGQLLWGPLNQTQTPWCKLTSGAVSSWRLGSVGVGEGVFTIYTFETRSFTGYSVATGQKLWGPVGPNTSEWGYYAQSSLVAYGTLYACDFGGYVNAYDVQTGELKWTYDTGSAGTATPYGIWPLLHIDIIADGKLYVLGGHTYSPPCSTVQGYTV